MRRIFAVLGVMLVLCGVRLYDNGIISSGYKGTFTAYGSGDSERVYSKMPLVTPIGKTTRLDFLGTEVDCMQALKNMNAVIKFTENIDGLKIIYAYTADIFKYKTVNGNRVNIMIAYKNGHIAIGSPLLKGSY